MMNAASIVLLAVSVIVGATLPLIADWMTAGLRRDRGGSFAEFVRRYSWNPFLSLALALASAGLVGLLLAMDGPSAKTSALMVFVGGLLLLFITDAKAQLLPDAITMPLLGLGLLAQLWTATRNIPVEASIVGAVIGYALLQVIRLAYRRLRGVEGLAYGDVKLMAAIGAWLGPLGVTASIFLGSVLALTWHGVAAWGDRARLARHVAFGPFLVTGALAALLLGVERS